MQRVRFVACGSSAHASRVVARVLRAVAPVAAGVAVASEVEGPGAPVDLTVAVSQSGETADVLRALEVTAGPVVAITNVPWSSLGQRADVVLDCRAGTERGVAATKTFTAQVVCGVVLALALAGGGERLGAGPAGHARALARLPEQLSRADSAGLHLAPDLVRHPLGAPGWLFLGAGECLPYAAEGALKLSELAYRFAVAHPVGELKHGPLALVESGTPVVLVDGAPRTRVAASVAEVRARGGCVVRVGGPGSDVPVLDGPVPLWGPLPAVVALQHLARALAAALGRDVDRPRNLAKSVTVA